MELISGHFLDPAMRLELTSPERPQCELYMPDPDFIFCYVLKSSKYVDTMNNLNGGRKGEGDKLTVHKAYMLNPDFKFWHELKTLKYADNLNNLTAGQKGEGLKLTEPGLYLPELDVIFC